VEPNPDVPLPKLEPSELPRLLLEPLRPRLLLEPVLERPPLEPKSDELCAEAESALNMHRATPQTTVPSRNRSVNMIASLPTKQNQWEQSSNGLSGGTPQTEILPACILRGTTSIDQWNLPGPEQPVEIRIALRKRRCLRPGQPDGWLCSTTTLNT